MEDILDDERIRQKIEVLEQQETAKERVEDISPDKDGSDLLAETGSIRNK